MSDDALTLLQQAQAQARKEATLHVGASTTDGKGEAHLGVNKNWNRWSVSVYLKTLLERGEKPNTAAGFEVEKKL